MLGAVVAACACALAAAAPALAGNGGLGPVPPKSPNAHDISTTYWLILAITGAIFVVVETALVVFIVRFRRGRRARTAEGPQIRGNTNLELAWTLVPVLILAAIVGYVLASLPGIQNVPTARAGQGLSVQVEGHQFYWEFRYPSGQVSVDTLVVPTGSVVRLTVVSADVIHSWWIPALAGKIDAIPGRVNHTWFKAPSTPATFQGQCAELCGLEHAAMRAWVKVVPPAQYARFLAAHAPSSLAVGKETWTGVCAKCHGLNGQGNVGPAIAGSPIIRSAATLTPIVREGLPPARTVTGMPAVGSGWTGAQIDALVRYVRSNPTLSGRGGQGGG